MLITDAFLFDCFVGHDDYDISSHVALCIYEKNSKVSGVAYPSRRQLGAINFAIRVETFWDDWALAGARYEQAKHLAFGYFQLDNIKCVDGIYNNGNLRWQNAPAGEKLRLSLLPPYVPLNK